MKRLIFLGICAAGSASAFASFELVLVADYTNKVIHRIDGTSGAYFGSFGGGFAASVLGMDIHIATNTCFVADRTSAKVLKFNYNTGEYLGSFVMTQTSAMGLRVTNAGNVLVDNYVGTATMYSPTGAVLANFAPQGAATGVYGIDEGPDGGLYGVMVGTNRIQRYNNAGAPVNFATTTIAPSVFQGVSVVNGTGYYTANGDNVVARFKATSPPSTLSNWNLASTFKMVRGVTGGHGDILYMSGTDTAGTAFKMARVDADTGAVRSTMSYAQISGDTVQIASVVAPEPGSVLAMSLGCALLARRRRSLG